MQTPPTPANEEKRLAALRRLGLLDTPPEERFDRYTRMARRLFGVESALVSLVDADRQWFKSRQGLDATETSREISFCGHAVANDEVLVVQDTLADSRFADNPLVTAAPSIRFYAGCPVHTDDGQAIGTLCLIDSAPRHLDDDDLTLLQDLAELVQHEFCNSRLATSDELTGLSNRRGFGAVAAHALSTCERLSMPVTMLYFDLDGFKAINDTYGHGEGDRALRLFANMLASSFREADVCARLGGDEFVVLCCGADLAAAAVPLARLQAAVADATADAGLPYSVRYSVGTVRYDPAIHAGIEGLLAVADRRMYERKRAARV